MQFFRNFFKLPGPKDLGKSISNYALPSRMFTPENKNYSWEDWHDEVKKLHPIKYFFVETLFKFIRNNIWYTVKSPFENAYYWTVSHLIPSKRYHMLDLRQPADDECDSYRYGWIDIDNRMLYAIFNLLNQFVEHEISNTYFPTWEDIKKDPGLQSQRDFVLEVRAIHEWWNVDRKMESKVKRDLLSAWSQARQNGLPNTNKLWTELQQSEIDFESKTDEMIARLMKIRRKLWT